MLFRKRAVDEKISQQDVHGVLAALNNVQAMIWFKPNGEIIDANENFLTALGYEIDEIKGKNHRIFVDDSYAETEEYREFWAKLGRGERHSGEFERFTKAGESVWIEASYNPIFDEDGKLAKVVKFAIDVTDRKIQAAESASQLKAMGLSQAVIEFDLKGNILKVNENFCKTLKYTAEEIVGQNHRMFVEPYVRTSAGYQKFWESLANGEYQAGEFSRVAKDGQEIWIQATYNPILDPNGCPFKVVKFASDITQEKMLAADSAGQLEAISKSQAVIEFNMDGTIVKANDNFLNAMGYSEEEVVGKHHRIFVKDAYAQSTEYTRFWASLKDGEFQDDEFLRKAKDGSDVWIQASYNPIFDPNGKPYKVVKYATEVTSRKRAVASFAKGLTALSEGDLSVRIPDELPKEFHDIRDAFNNTMVLLDDLVKGILDASFAISSETDSIAANAADLSSRGERQAATLEETAAAMEEISMTVKSTAENAETATSAADVASQHAEKGGNVVNEAIAAMHRIEQSTEKISNIVQVIDEIAFQTNLLALNAGVEAARAGDSGRGFAVVASEVRALAQRASDSARDIKELIATSNKEVQEGSVLVNNSGGALAEIMTSVTDVVENINGILNASREQSIGITEVTQAVTEIDKTTQHTAGLAEESSAAATLLAERAASLEKLITFFNQPSNDRSNVQEIRPDVKAPATAAKPPSTPTPENVKKVASAVAATPAVSGDDGNWAEF